MSLKTRAARVRNNRYTVLIANPSDGRNLFGISWVCDCHWKGIRVNSGPFRISMSVQVLGVGGYKIFDTQLIFDLLDCLMKCQTDSLPPNLIEAKGGSIRFSPAPSQAK